MPSLKPIVLAVTLGTSILTVTSGVAETALSQPAFSAVDAAMAAADRPPEHKSRDEARKAEIVFLLPYLKAGDQVLDMGAGGGYVSMLMSTAVGDTGHVYAQSPATWVERYKMQPALEYLTSRRRNISAVVAPFTDIPAPAKAYDLIYASMIYHDTYNEPDADALAMNKALFKALKPGGYYIIVDHRAPEGSGARDTNTTHRIDEITVIGSVKAAGFRLVSESPVLSHAEDDRTLNVFDPKVRGKTDRMVLVFKKP